MILYLILLIAIHEMLHLALPPNPLQQKLWSDIPFSLNLGWICIATIANIAALCVQNHWGYSSLSQPAWAVTMIIIGTLIALFYVLTRRNLFLGMVVIWALYGIVQKRRESGDVGSQHITEAAFLCIAAIVAAISIILFKRKKVRPLFSQP